MAEKWTEGPWEIHGLAVVGADGRTVCLIGEPAQYPGDLSSDFHNKKANAPLIAAAPIMAEALECWPLQELLGMVEDSGDAEMWDRAKWFMEVRDDVLRKARGEMS